MRSQTPPAEEARPGGDRRWPGQWTILLALYALGATVLLLQHAREVFDDLLGPTEAQLIIVSDGPLENIEDTFDGARVRPRPDLLDPWPWRRDDPTRPRPQPASGVPRDPTYVLFPRLRYRQPEPVLTVAWRRENQARRVERPLEALDEYRLCLVVLRIGADGHVIPPNDPDRDSPFRRSCARS